MHSGGNEPTPTVLMTRRRCRRGVDLCADLCAALPEIPVCARDDGPAPRARRNARPLPARQRRARKRRLSARMDGGRGADLPASRHWLAGLARRHSADLVHVNGYAHAGSAPIGRCSWSRIRMCCRGGRRFTANAAPPEWDDYRDEVAAGLAAADPRCRAEPRGARRSRTPLRLRARRCSGDPERHRSRRLSRRRETAGRPGRRPAVGCGEEPRAPRRSCRRDSPGRSRSPETATNPEGGTARCEAAGLLGVLSPAEMAGHLGRAAIFAAPARYEPFGLAILEAAASGCALGARRHSVIARKLGRRGGLCRPRGPVGLAHRHCAT